MVMVKLIVLLIGIGFGYDYDDVIVRDDSDGAVYTAADVNV